MRLPLILALSALLLVGCKRQHYPATDAVDLGYPTCPAGSETKLLAEGHIRSGPMDTRLPIVEHFRIERRGCYNAVVVRQEWPVQIADVEAIYDDAWTPLRVWRRWTVPASQRADGQADIKRYELRSPEIAVKHRDDMGKVDFETYRTKKKPVALVGPGRGMLTAWLWRAKLGENGRVREPVMDFRGVEKVEDVTLTRGPDRYIDSLGKTVRVYTFYGRETVFTDEKDVVIGDLAGLVPSDRSPLPEPKSMPRFEPVDPVHTP
jgi:hypothetical protein